MLKTKSCYFKLSAASSACLSQNKDRALANHMVDVDGNASVVQ